MNCDNDEAFMSLLSSQRELLAQINHENDNRHRDGNKRRHMSLTWTFDTLYPNRSICDAVNNEEVVWSKLDNDILGYPTIVEDGSKFALGADVVGYDNPPRTYSKGDKEYDLGLDDFMAGKKRRLSSIGFFSTLFQEDIKQRRLSFQSMENFETCTDLLDDDLLLNFIPEPSDVANSQPAKCDPKEAKKLMEALSSAMEKSQKSQQDIHDWDREMGLKRSHSKTMRLSTRSRKRLRAMLKKQVNALSSKKT